MIYNTGVPGKMTYNGQKTQILVFSLLATILFIVAHFEMTTMLKTTIDTTRFN